MPNTGNIRAGMRVGTAGWPPAATHTVYMAQQDGVGAVYIGHTVGNPHIALVKRRYAFPALNHLLAAGYTLKVLGKFRSRSEAARHKATVIRTRRRNGEVVLNTGGSRRAGHTRLPCNLCKRDLPATDFARDRRRAGGRSHRCRDCNAFLLRCQDQAVRAGDTSSIGWRTGSDVVKEWAAEGYDGRHPRFAGS